MLILVDKWEDIIENFQSFNSSIMSSDCIAVERLNRFYHWYYLPSLKIFAPSKFLGYKGMTLFSYKGDGTGVDTQKALKPFFNKLTRESNEYKTLIIELSQFLRNFNKDISVKTTSGSGGIYIPKNTFSDTLLFNQNILNTVTKDIESVMDEENDLIEGELKERYVNVYERKPSIRAKAIEIHGTVCQVCGFNFEQKYGARGIDFIEVHHKIPLSHYTREVKVNPIEDLAVLCSNCHRMIHREKSNVLSIDDLKQMIKKHSTAHNSQ